ncbi:MAG: hypothetical protein RIF33_09050 [Cyclobacteriaceae bacterium]
MTFYSDLHCHPTGMNFPKFSVEDESRLASAKAHPWRIKKGNKNKLAKGKRATAYSQSDFARLIHGKVKLVIASLYPFEHAFLNHVRKTPDGDSQKYSSYLDLQRSAPGFTTALVLGITKDRVYYMRDDKFDYWNELNKEYEFMLRKSGIPAAAKIRHDQDEDGKIRKGEKKIRVKGTYWVVARNPDHVAYNNPYESNVGFKPAEYLDTVLHKENETAVVLTIEGMHSLSMANHIFPVGEDELMSRIKTIKKWDPPILFMTFGHHFDNNLCSHAHSIFRVPILEDWNPDQTVNMNYITDPIENPTQDRSKGFTRLGFKAVLELLHLKEVDGNITDQASEGHRILIDTKHMSASARMEMYRRIIEPYNQTKPEDKHIPVIASHSAYSGITTLKQMIARYNDELDKFPPERRSEFLTGYGFNPWNINLSDEDIHIICLTKGLIGISFDQRILGLPDSQSKDNNWNNIDLIINNILGMLKAAKGVDKHLFDSNEHSIWDCFSIGTDFNGVIDPVNKYPTAIDFEEFATDLREKLNSPMFEEYNITNDNVNQVVERISFMNIQRFVKKHLST